MVEFTTASLAELFVKCTILFVCGSFLFDIVHYTLHVFENSRFRILRWLGGLHGVHHLFLDKEMQIQKTYSFKNIILHILPEYMTAVIGITLLGLFVFGWVPATIVIAIRTVMVIIYILQRGEDFTHKPLTRISGQRSLFFVGPQYHSLHHVYPLQYYSSFVNIFDMIFGTNCQIRDRKFVFKSTPTEFEHNLIYQLKKSGASIASEASLSDVEVLILTQNESTDPSELFRIIEDFKQIGKQRLLPPEVWLLNFSSRPQDVRVRSYYSDKDLTFRYISAPPHSSLSAKITLLLIKRGFRYIRLSSKGFIIRSYLRFLLTSPRG